MKKARIGIVGEYYSTRKSHTSLNQSLEWLKNIYEFDYEWIATEKVEKDGEGLLKRFSGIWSAPGSPFNSLTGALKAIEFARTKNVPHLGTCAGFQHTIIEFARNVLGIKDAQHEEYDNKSSTIIVSKLACSLAGKTMSIRIKEGTKAFGCYKKLESIEDYYCNFGISPEFKNKLIVPDLSISGIDQDGEIRIIEMPKNDFFVATLFVPQSRATKEQPHPIIKGFVEECVRRGRD